MIHYQKIQNWIVEAFEVSPDSFIIALWYVGASCDLQCELCEIFTTDCEKEASFIWCELVRSTHEMLVRGRKSGSVLCSPSTPMKGDTKTDQIFPGSGLEEPFYE